MATERVEIVVSTTGAAAAASEIESIGKSASSVSTTLGFLRAALVAIASFDIVLRFTSLADAFQDVQNRLVLVTNDIQTQNAAFQGLFDVAQATRQSLETTSDVFSRLSRAVAGTGATYAQMLEVTRGVNEALLISGASGTRAKQGLIELAEGMALGNLQGRQLRSLITDIPELANVMGEKLGVAGSQLYEFAQKNPGKLTPQLVIQSILDALPRLDAQMSRAGLTFEQVFTRFQNSLETFLGQLNRATGATQLLDNALQTIARHFGQIALAVAGFGALIIANFAIGQILTFGTHLTAILGLVTGLGRAFSLLLVPFTAFRTIAVVVGAVIVAPFQLLGLLVTGLVATFSALVNPLQTVVALFGALRVAILTNPLFLIGAAVLAGLVAAFYLFRTQIEGVVQSLGGFKTMFNTVVNAASAAVLTVIALWRQLPQAFADIGLSMANAIVQGLQDGINKIVDAYTHMKNYVTGVIAAIKNGQELPTFASTAPTSDQQSTVKLPDIANPYVGAIEKIKDEYTKQFTALQATGTNPLSKAFDDGVAAAKRLLATVNSLGTNGKAAGALLNQAIPGQMPADIDSLDKKVQSLLSKISPLLAAKFQIDTLNNELAQPGVDKVLQGYGFTKEDVQRRTERSIVGVGNAATDLTEKQQVLKKALDDGAISADEYSKEMTKLQLAFDNTQTTFGAGVERTFLKMQQQVGDVASGIEKVLNDAFSSATDAIVEFVNTGKISVGSLAQTIEQDLLKSAIHGLIAQYGGALFGATAPGAKGFGTEGASLIGSLFGSGSQAGASEGGSMISKAGSWLGGLFGFASGGSFEVGQGTAVGEINGVDNRLIAFRARDGERVTVTPNGQAPGGVSQTFIINTPDANSFRRSKSQLQTEALIGAQRAARRNMGS